MIKKLKDLLIETLVAASVFIGITLVVVYVGLWFGIGLKLAGL